MDVEEGVGTLQDTVEDEGLDFSRYSHERVDLLAATGVPLLIVLQDVATGEFHAQEVVQGRGK